MDTENKQQEIAPPIIETKPSFEVLGRYFDKRKDAEDYWVLMQNVDKVKNENIEKIKAQNQSVVCVEKDGVVDLVVEEQQWLCSVEFVTVWSDEKVYNWDVPLTIIDDATYINKLFNQLEDGMSVTADSIKSGIFATLTVMERCGNTEHKKFLALLAQLDIYPVYVDRD